MASWVTFGIVCFMLVRFLKQDPKPLEPFIGGVKPCILVFIITWWGLYGGLFMGAFADLVPQWVEQFLWTGMDVIMKLSHTVVLMAWRDTEWDIDVVANRQKSEAERIIAILDRQRAINERDLARLRKRVYKNAGNVLSPVPAEDDGVNAAAIEPAIEDS